MVFDVFFASQVHLMASGSEDERADTASLHLGFGLTQFGDLVKQHKNGRPFRFVPFWLVWWVSCQSIFSGVAGEHSGANMQGTGHAGFGNETLPGTAQLLQTQGMNFPRTVSFWRTIFMSTPMVYSLQRCALVLEAMLVPAM